MSLYITVYPKYAIHIDRRSYKGRGRPRKSDYITEEERVKRILEEVEELNDH